MLDDDNNNHRPKKKDILSFGEVNITSTISEENIPRHSTERVFDFFYGTKIHCVHAAHFPLSRREPHMCPKHHRTCPKSLPFSLPHNLRQPPSSAPLLTRGGNDVALLSCSCFPRPCERAPSSPLTNTPVPLRVVLLTLSPAPTCRLAQAAPAACPRHTNALTCSCHRRLWPFPSLSLALSVARGLEEREGRKKAGWPHHFK
ncbi:hypothetical protein Taro_015116 [Colocasia esculenta]|uniref:Uncharacterized protein n=1 Tax=Colocasia esculenta TaxID=4460 RepID=A0A843UNV0_COLES|nr:hypothetical protein [Colocasia esculenta]